MSRAHPDSDSNIEIGSSLNSRQNPDAWRMSLSLSLAAYFVLQIFWITVTPLREQSLPDSMPNHSQTPLLIGTGPDEVEHYLYILSVAKRGELPPPTAVWRTSQGQYVSHEGQHPPLFYLIDAVLFKIVSPFGEHVVWYALRIFGTVLGAITILVLSIAARKAFPNSQFIGLVTPPFLSFLPIFSYMTATLSNLPLEMAITSVAWLRLIEIARGERKIDVKNGLFLGALFGVALLVRVTTLLWVPAVAIILVGTMIRAPKADRAASLAGVVTCALVSAVFLAPWLVHMKHVYGAMFFRSDYRPLLYNVSLWHWIMNPDEKLQMYGTEHFLSMPPRTIALWYCSTSWMPFWLAQALPNYTETGGAVQAVFVIVDVLVAVVLFLNWSRSKRSGAAPDTAARLLLWASCTSIVASILSVLQQQLFVDGIIIAYAGRYTVSVVAASSLLFLFAVSTVVKPNAPKERLAALGLAVLMLAFNIWSLLLIHQFYLPQTAPASG